MADLLWALLVPRPGGRRLTAARNRLADGLAIVLALLYGGLMVRIGDATARGAAVPWQADVAIGVAAALALGFRRRAPLRLAVLLMPLGAVSVMAGGPILFALFTVAVRRRAVVALALAGANVATGVLYYLLQDTPPYPLWVDLVVRSAVGLAAIGWGLFVQAYRRLTGSLRAHAYRLEAEQQLRVDQARLTERTRIAREMHDVLAHRMSMVSLHAGALEVRPDARPAEVTAAAAVIRAAAHDALQELRSVIGMLREEPSGPPDPPQPGLGDLAGLIADARTTGMNVDFRFLIGPHSPSIVLGRTAYRLVQEGLTNAAKHAPGAPVDVLLDGDAGADLRIRVTNEYIHGPKDNKYIHGPKDSEYTHGPKKTDTGLSDTGAGMGLVGVGERVELAGGRVAYGPAGGHFRLEAWLPWPDREQP
jgi:signal transduction histidine kinase